MSRKYLRIAITEEQAEEFKKRKYWAEKEAGVKMTDSSFASSLIKMRLEERPQNVKMDIIADFMKRLIGNEDIDADTRKSAAHIILAIAWDLPIAPP